MHSRESVRGVVQDGASLAEMLRVFVALEHFATDRVNLVVVVVVGGVTCFEMEVPVCVCVCVCVCVHVCMHE